MPLCTAVIGCSHTVPDDEVPRWTEEDPHGYYTFYGEMTRKCVNTRHETFPNSIITTPQESSCVNLRPGLSIMQHGYAREAFPPVQDERRLRDIVFFFSCDANETKTIDGYQRPSEVKHLTPTPRTLGFKRLVSKPEMLKTFAEDVELTEKGNAYVVFLPILRLNLSQTITSAGYLAEQVEGHEVALQNLKPSTQLSREYRELQTPFESHIINYYKFVRNYGTDVIRRSTFGGRFQVLVTNERLVNEINVADEENLTTVDHLVNECIRMEKNSFTEVTLLVEGGPASSRNNIKEWQREVMTDPVPISPQLLPIHSFLKSFGTPEQKRGLEEMVKFENRNHDIRKLLFELKLLEQPHRLSSFLISLLHGEVNMVCPSKNVYSVVKDGIINPKNINFHMFHVTCTHTRYYSLTEEKDLIVSRKYKLIPGVCFSLAIKLTPCVKASMKLPDGVNCVYFFKQKECKGMSTTVKTEAEIVKAFNSYQLSFMLCPSLKV
ncbi:hypothetical protein Ocin01_18293 [Orchesella cincta]|uniref:MACPF domain-containing protein n=1 Tax=Orchesella cincta TaxID=48709 RepID=A0A1D2M5Y9_ORCCI|nr:hypothetical protein Ocin01_18293 [Orchesella cincta]